MELIPGLPDDVAHDCLVRVMYNHFSALISVCKSWKFELQSPQFRRLRRDSGTTQKLIVVAQAQVHQKDETFRVLKYRPTNPVYSLAVFELDTGVCRDFPPIPELSTGLPLFCQVVCVGSDLVVLGGLDPATWNVSDSVFVFNFLSATWRRGSDMPGVRRSFFGCASDCYRRVFVVGGHDCEKNALRSVLAYDVASDEWVPLPDMARERDECKAVFHGGMLHVIGGYCTEMQGKFEKSAEVLDVATWRWNDVQEDLLFDATCPRTCVIADEELYICHRGNLLARKGTTWRVVAKLPADATNVAYMTTWRGKLSVIGSKAHGVPHKAYVLDLENYKWTRMEIPEKYSGHVQSGCYLEI